MTETNQAHSELDSTETLFHDIATPLLIAKIKAGLLASYLPQLIKTLAESPHLLHLLPDDKKVIDALISAPEIMVSNLEVVQKKINLLSESIQHQANNFGTYPLGDNLGAKIPNLNLDQAMIPSVRTPAIKTILLVDDEVVHRDIGESLLAPHYQVDFAENGLEAIRKCEQKQYDLILMDLHMPKMNGEQATIALRTRVSNETIIIGLTSLPLGANQSGLLARGFTDFLEKPLSMKGLQNILQAYSRNA
ncbi:response regulator [Cellvibrio sp. OA-2007]|uniref:response regulator n=1 Tax=Cellvibrio sp. OA-2007 TaxID=529823 RepID=UPI000782A356|nr:response regulator [Cellvibrio sp. OA-2007]